MKGPGIGIGRGPEFDAIREIITHLGDAAAGIGDDAAMMDVPRGERIVVSTDASVENRHFREGWLTPEEIGYRAVTAALSDLAAMAARPLAIVWAFNVPDRWRPSVSRLADGGRDGAVAAGAVIVGGNLTAATELSITTTVIGSAYAPLHRSGARVGDGIYVTGRLGGPALALKAFANGHVPDPGHRERFARPVARIREARWLADRGATAAIDISDGLAGDATHLHAATGKGIEISLDRVPRMSGADIRVAAISGEEYELLVTAPELDVQEFERRFAVPLTKIGAVTDSGDLTFLSDGQPIEMIGGGFDHFSK